MKWLRFPHPTIHFLLDVNGKALEDMERELCELPMNFVHNRLKTIVFGDGKNWKDVEAET